ncbi:uncharacterized protein PHALS_05804 [Plasmopara halstedii]|uniref:Uncharacterized protein n=1 Tax=Plasmopara halstedii TaxID=4781 RepID=A0A0P1AAF6_PLAHL|nr:uncharacterized protein PHALS_05804 [Plasmopara halstedii]CEG37749.1 hypothetical protein PHALS_05804 [Plasmopara halstedii]|eukprot:XP_024574118.1 hypothetical protein PHALS_05804 [Plasmopara halstedii]
MRVNKIVSYIHTYVFRCQRISLPTEFIREHDLWSQPVEIKASVDLSSVHVSCPVDFLRKYIAIIGASLYKATKLISSGVGKQQTRLTFERKPRLWLDLVFPFQIGRFMPSTWL